MELRHYIEVIRRRWWLLLLGPIVAGVVAYSVSESQTDIYQAETTLLINHTETAGILQLDDVLASERLSHTYAELISQRPMLTAVITDLSLSYSEEDLKRQIEVEAVTDTQLLRVRVKNADAALAAAIANTLSQDFIASNEAQSDRAGTVSVVEAATPPTTRVEPRVLLNTSMAVALGLLVAGAIVVALESLDYRVKTTDDLTALGLTPLMVVPRFPRYGGRKRSQLDTIKTAWLNDTKLAEIYRFLRTSIEFATIAHPAQVFLVTSANPLEGKSTTAINLAVAMAKGGHRTILIDANLRCPALHFQFGVANDKGLTTILSSQCADVRDFLVPTSVPGLALIPSGALPPNAPDLFASGRMAWFLERAKKECDFVIIDSPAMNEVADASRLAGDADATLLVLQANKTQAQAVTACLESLRRAQAWTVGAVLNKMTRRDGQFSAYGLEG